MLEKIVTIASEVQSLLKTIFAQGLECAQHYWNKKTNHVLGTGTRGRKLAEKAVLSLMWR